MVKKKLNILSHILLSVLSLGLFFTILETSSEASSFSVNTVKTALQHLKDNGYLNSFNIDTATGVYRFGTGINNNDYKTFAIYQLTDNRVVCCVYWNNTSNNSNGSGSSWYWNSSGSSTSNSWGNTSQVLTSNIAVAYSPNTAITNLDLPIGQIFDINAPTFTFTPEFIAQTTGNPVLNINKFDYKSSRINLGIIEDLDYYSIEVRFKNEYGIIIGSDLDLTNQNNYTNLEWESNALYRYGKQLYANTVYLNYEKTYNLNFKVYSDRNNYDEFDFYYIFYPPNAIIENGAVISAGSGDYDNQDLSLAIQNNHNELMGFLTSSDVSSGEEPTLDDITAPVVPDVTEDFFTWLMNSVLDILYNNNDSTLELPLYNTTHYIRSDIYKLNIEPLKTFIQAAWWFIVGVPVLKYIRRSIERLKGGELPATDDKSDLLGNIL